MQGQIDSQGRPFNYFPVEGNSQPNTRRDGSRRRPMYIPISPTISDIGMPSRQVSKRCARLIPCQCASSRYPSVNSQVLRSVSTATARLVSGEWR